MFSERGTKDFFTDLAVGEKFTLRLAYGGFELTRVKTEQVFILGVNQMKNLTRLGKYILETTLALTNAALALCNLQLRATGVVTKNGNKTIRIEGIDDPRLPQDFDHIVFVVEQIN